MDFGEEKEGFFFLRKGYVFRHGAIERKGCVSLTVSKILCTVFISAGEGE